MKVERTLPVTMLGLSCCLLVALSSNLLGQQAFYGTIQGNITDASGAVIPNAKIEVTDVEKGVTISVTTGQDGFYKALNLNPGSYTVKASAPGFETLLREAIGLEGGQDVRIDIRLGVGVIGQQIVVADKATPLINTETATTRLGEITHEMTTTLPNTGSATQVFPDVYNQLLNGYADINNSAFSVGGALSQSNAEVQDGMRIEGQSDPVGGGRGFVRPAIEAVEALVVTTSLPSARYHNPAAIEMVMKSGSNDFHGSAWYQHGNSILNADAYFTHTRAPFILHQYGGSVGGPIFKNKTFFFGSYQGLYYPNLAYPFGTIPTPEMKTGNLSAFLDPSYVAKIGLGKTIQVTDPVSGQPFPNNIIPLSRISPVATKVLSVYPNPNYDSGRGYVNSLITPQLLLRKMANFDTRVDHYFTPTQHLYGRFSYFHSPNGANQTNLPGFGGNWFIEEGRVLTLHHTSTISPNLLNHVMFGFFRAHFPGGAGLFQSTNTPWNQNLGISGVPTNQDFGFPYLTFSQTALTTPVSYGPTDLKEHIYQFSDDVTWTKGRHKITGGFDFRRDVQGSLIPGTGQTNGGSCQFGCMTFNGRWTGLDFADFLLGLPFTSTLNIQPPPDLRDRNEWGGFIQDDVRLSPRLNLSLGLRYDYYPVVRSEHDMEAMFVPSLNKLVFPSQQGISRIPQGLVLPLDAVTAASVGLPSGLIRTSRMNLQPRIGLAWRAMSNTVVRSGFGVYRTPLVSTGRSLLNGPFSITSDFPSAQPPVGGTPLISINQPYAAVGTPRPLLNFFAPEGYLKVPLHYNWDLAVEHQFGGNAVTLEYVGKTSIVPYNDMINVIPPSLTPFNRANLPFPALGSLQGVRNGAHYTYNALRADVRRRLSSGLYFDATFVHARTIDDLSGISGELGGNPENPFNRLRDRGTSSFMPPSRLTVNFIYQVPFGKGMLALPESGPGRAANWLVKGWEMGGTLNFQSSGPLTATGNYLNAAGQNYDAPNTNAFSGRPNATGQSITPTSAQQAAGYQFNPLAFSNVVSPGNYGTAGKTTIPGTGTLAINFSVFRNFPIATLIRREGANFRMGALMFNAINHSNVPQPGTNMNSVLFGLLATDKSGDTRTIAVQGRIDF